MPHSAGFFGLPGTGKSNSGLSYPGRLQHWVLGSSEETSEENFKSRKDSGDIVPTRFNWMDTLKPESQAKFLVDPMSQENFEKAQQELGTIVQIGKAKNVARVWHRIRTVRASLLSGEDTETKTIFLDNVTPLFQEFEDYVQVVYKHRVFTQQGELNVAAYSQVYQAEVMDFMRDFCQLPCYAVFSCHVGMSTSEEIGATVRFFDMSDPKKPMVPREWQPLIMGKARYRISSVPDFAFFLETESPPGLPMKYLHRLVPNDSRDGIGKPRLQPFVNPREIQFPKNQFYPTFNAALEAYLKTGQVVANPTGGK